MLDITKLLHGRSLSKSDQCEVEVSRAPIVWCLGVIIRSFSSSSLISSDDGADDSSSTSTSNGGDETLYDAADESAVALRGLSISSRKHLLV